MASRMAGTGLEDEIHTKLNIKIDAQGGVNKYPAKSHCRRVAEQLGVDDGTIFLTATKASNWPNSDMPAPFRQDRYFYYLTGCNEPDCYTTYNIKKDVLTLALPPIDEDRVVWYGRGSTIEEALEKYDIDEAHYIKAPAAKSVKTFVLRSENQDTQGLPDLRRAIDACRVIKDDHEIDLIRQANLITADAHVAVLKGMHTFESEADVEAAYMKVCIQQRAKIQAYDPIAGSGANAAELHYSDNDADFGKGQTVVLDAGCEFERYASDVTRTFPINRKNPGHWPSKEAMNIYSLVEDIQETCIKQMLPGKQFIEIYWSAHYQVIDGLLKLGVLKGNRDEIFHAGTSRAFLPHGLGHHVGLEVHDVSPVPHPPIHLTEPEQQVQAATNSRTAFLRWKPEAAERLSHSMIVEQTFQPGSRDFPALKPNMVVTVEPGIYFNAFLLEHFFLNHKKHRKFIDRDVLDRYMQVGGVRIEDDILITKDGYSNLTTAPKGAEMLEIMRKSARQASS